MFGRWFSFPIGWFLGSMLIFRGVVAKVTGMMVTPEVLCQEARVTFQQHFDALRWGPKIFLPPKSSRILWVFLRRISFCNFKSWDDFGCILGHSSGIFFLVPFPVQRRGWHSTMSQMFNHQRGGGGNEHADTCQTHVPDLSLWYFCLVLWRVFFSRPVMLIQSMPGVLPRLWSQGSWGFEFFFCEIFEVTNEFTITPLEN